ncbi:uncharacterized protein N7511_003291 [Penicillium nucicola]|uniref:uncharacterized protein n=1 Tax=Penicillium nucicola TaxID=1850975 RepID=UPI00254598EC|nr:uncharacterized protein N7511_003291 [Penicillium nucicola]KAJ5771240.1 hypothetical protein N7511_003291 [Penicillium nucicola]
MTYIKRDSRAANYSDLTLSPISTSDLLHYGEITQETVSFSALRALEGRRAFRSSSDPNPTLGLGGIQRLRNTLSKISPSALAEKELLRKKNQYKIPLTERNVDTLVTAQECNEAYKPRHSPEIQVTEWLERVS